MDEQDKHPKSEATRGGVVGPWERCVDCPPFTNLDQKVDRLDRRVDNVSSRLLAVEKQQTEQTFQIKAVSGSVGRVAEDVREVLTWLRGKNGTDGFKEEWVRWSTKFDGLGDQMNTLRESLKERRTVWQKWGMGILAFIVTAILVFGWGLARDAVRRGVVP